MVKKRILQPASVWDTALVEEAFVEAGIKPGHIQRLYRHLIRNPNIAWEDVPDLPNAAKQILADSFTHCTSQVVNCQTSASKDTSKLLLRLQDGMEVEAVIMHYDTSVKERHAETAQQPLATPDTPDCIQDAGDDAASEAPSAAGGGKRATLCVSSQVGCIMGCTFCATGTMGIKGDLTAGEIIEQLVHARAVLPIRNIVFMGMGEPLNNYPAVSAAAKMMTSSAHGFSLRRSAVTISTVGVIPRMLQLPADLPGISLALSLHAPTQEVRRTIVPSAQAYPLDKLITAVDKYQLLTRQRIFVEYVMLAGVNDSAEQAHQLGRLLQGRDLVINLIPWNPVYSPDFSYEAPGDERTSVFHKIVREEYGLPCTVRQEKGQDIAGACGQLVVENGSGSKCATGGGLADLEDLARNITQTAVVS